MSRIAFSGAATPILPLSCRRRPPTNTTALFYRDRARQAESDAATATLDNVRDRWLRAAKSWDEMATRAEKTAERRSVNEDAKLLAEMDASED